MVIRAGCVSLSEYCGGYVVIRAGCVSLSEYCGGYVSTW